MVSISFTDQTLKRRNPSYFDFICSKRLVTRFNIITATKIILDNCNSFQDQLGCLTIRKYGLTVSQPSV